MKSSKPVSHAPLFATGGLLPVLLFTLCGATQAADWDGSESVDWNDPLNWAGDATPDGAPAGIQSATGNIATISADSAFSPSEVIIGGWFATGRLDHTAGMLATQNVGWPPGWFLVGFGPTGNATYNLADTSTTGGAFTGFGTGSGSLNCVDALFIGEPGGSNDGTGVGTVNVNTTGSLAVAFDLNVGVSGWTGNLNVDAGTVTANNLYVARTNNGNATGGVGNFNMSGGDFTLNYRLNLANGDPLVPTSANVGVATLSGGTLRTDDATDDFWASGVAMAPAAWDGVSGSGVGGTGGTATFNLDGGVLSTLWVMSENRVDDMGTPEDAGDDVTYAKGTSTFNFNGGVLQAQANMDAPWLPFMGNLTNAFVKAGGAVIDSNGFNLLVAQPLLEDPGSTGGGFTKSGDGQLEMTAPTTISGPVVVAGGTLFSNPGNAPVDRAFSYASGITVNSGATLVSSSNGLFGWDGTQERPILVEAGGVLATSGSGVDVGVGVVTLAGGELAGANSSDYGSWRFDNPGDSLVATEDSTVSATGVKFANGATIDVAAGKTLTFAFGGIIGDTTLGGQSSVVKTGAGALVFADGHYYTGDTEIAAGSLSVTWDDFADDSTVRIHAGAILDLDTFGATDTIESLIVDAEGGNLAPGLYRATDANGGSGDGTQLSSLTGDGKLLVTGPPASGYGTWALTNVGDQTEDQDFNGDGVANGIAYFMNDTGVIMLPGVVGGAVTWTNGGNIAETEYGTQFVVETSPDLVNWTDVDAADPNLSNTAGSVSYTLPAGETEFFVRLSVTPN